MPFIDIKFYDENFGIASSGVSHVVMTDDGGKHWRNVKIAYTPDLSGHSDLVYSIQIPSYTTAYVIHNHTYIYKYTRDFNDVVEEKIDTDFEVSPNPATDYLEISDINPMLKHGVEYSAIKILNIYGQTVLSVGAIHELPLRIDVSGLAPGMYFVRIGDRVQKFIKY